MIKNENVTLNFGNKVFEVSNDELKSAHNAAATQIHNCFNAELEGVLKNEIPEDYERRMMWVVIKSGTMLEVIVGYMLRSGCDAQRLKDTFAMVVDKEVNAMAQQVMQIALDDVIAALKKGGKS